MREKILTKEEILTFASRQEEHLFDKKSKEVSGKGIQKTAATFASSDGGDFIIGIKGGKEEPDTNKRRDGKSNKEFLVVSCFG